MSENIKTWKVSFKGRETWTTQDKFWGPVP